VKVLVKIIGKDGEEEKIQQQKVIRQPRKGWFV
jgi:hypothetical protein